MVTKSDTRNSAALEGVLVTGADGFVGSHLLRALTVRGARPRALFGPEVPPPAEPLSGVTYFHGDIEDVDLMKTACGDARLVFHLAGLASVADSFRRPEEHERVHLGGTRALLAAFACGRRVVYVSSAEVYGPSQTTAVDEAHPIAPRSPYGEAKVGAESALRGWGTDHGTEVAVLRLFSTYGPRRGDCSVIGDLVRQARTGDALRPFDLRPVRDFCHVDDVVEALLAAGSAPLAEPFRVFNIGSGRPVSIEQLARTILEASDRDLPIVTRDGSDRPTERDVDRLVANPGRARRELGWESRITLLDGMRALLAALEK